MKNDFTFHISKIQQFPNKMVKTCQQIKLIDEPEQDKHKFLKKQIIYFLEYVKSVC